VTRKNVQILNAIREVLRSDTRVLVFDVPMPHITRINLAVLRIAISELGKKGIYISIDRPDRNVLSILERHNVAVPGESVTATTGIERSSQGIAEMAIARVPANPQGGPPSAIARNRILIISGIFCPTLFLDSVEAAIRSPSEGTANLLKELQNMDFIMIDNISTMAAYNSGESIAEFFRRFDIFLGQFPRMRAYLTTDSKAQMNIFDMAKGLQGARLAMDRTWF